MVILAYFALLLAAFFFFIVRPQRRNLTRHRALVSALTVGDDVVTASGIHGTIRSLADTTLELEIAPGVVITLARAAVSQILRPDPPPDPPLDPTSDAAGDRVVSADGVTETPESRTESSD